MNLKRGLFTAGLFAVVIAAVLVFPVWMRNTYTTDRDLAQETTRTNPPQEETVRSDKYEMIKT